MGDRATHRVLSRALSGCNYYSSDALLILHVCNVLRFLELAIQHRDRYERVVLPGGPVHPMRVRPVSLLWRHRERGSVMTCSNYRTHSQLLGFEPCNNPFVTVQAASPRSPSALLAALPAAVGVILALVSAIVQYAAIDGGQTKKLTGLDAFLGLPSVGISIVFFALFVAWFIGSAAGAEYTHSLYVGAIVVASARNARRKLAVVVLNFSFVAVVLVVAAVALLIFTILGCRDARVAAVAPQVAARRSPSNLRCRSRHRGTRRPHGGLQPQRGQGHGHPFARLPR